MHGSEPAAAGATTTSSALDLLQRAGEASVRAADLPGWELGRPEGPDELLCLLACRQRIADPRYADAVDRVVTRLGARREEHLPFSNLSGAARALAAVVEAFLETGSETLRDLAATIARQITDGARKADEDGFVETATGEPASTNAAMAATSALLSAPAVLRDPGVEAVALAALEQARSRFHSATGDPADATSLASALLDAHQLTADPLHLHRAFGALRRAREGTPEGQCSSSLASAMARYNTAMGWPVFADRLGVVSKEEAGTPFAAILDRLVVEVPLVLEINWWDGAGPPPRDLSQAARSVAWIGKTIVYRRVPESGTGRISASIDGRTTGAQPDPAHLSSALGTLLTQAKVSFDSMSSARTSSHRELAAPAAATAPSLAAAEPEALQVSSDHGETTADETFPSVESVAAQSLQGEGWATKVPILGALVAFLLSLLEVLSHFTAGKEPPPESGKA